VAWRSTDPGIASVDSIARVSAGMSGRATLVASSGDLTAELPLEVYPVPATITLLAGDGQHAPAAHRLPGPVKAQVVSRGGRPMAGVSVRFGVTDGAGRVDRESDTSDADGIVLAAWILGPHPGRQRITLGVDGDPPIATAVLADADPVPENTRIALRGEMPSGRAGETLAAAVVIRVADSAGAPVTDVPVAWDADGGGSIAGDAPRTDSLGEATARWTLGPRSGTQQSYVQVGSSRAVPRFALRAAALPGPAVTLVPVRKGPVRGAAGLPLAAPVGLRVNDRAGNPVPGVPIAVRPSSGSASLGSPATDSAGRVAIAWTLGPAAGTQRLSASAQGVDRPLEITAQVRAGRAGKATLEGLPASATAGQPLTQPVAVIVTDAYGNGVAGTQVAFTSRSGKLTPGRARTDSTGRAAVRWLLGPAIGDQQLEATVKESGLRTAGKVRAVAPGKRKR
jgi:hypothetical protein